MEDRKHQTTSLVLALMYHRRGKANKHIYFTNASGAQEEPFTSKQRDFIQTLTRPNTAYDQLPLPKNSLACPFSTPSPLPAPFPGGRPRPLEGFDPLAPFLAGAGVGFLTSCRISFDRSRAKW